MPTPWSEQLAHIPHAPGVYLMRDATSHILYIGKARDLAKRLASYVHRQDLTHKLNALLTAVQQIDYLPTQSEREALLLERRLIRRYQPRFNTLWRDDKSYPYLKLTLQEDFPRLTLTRRVKRDGAGRGRRARYFGPFPNVSQVKQLLRYLWKRKVFPLRPCKFEFSEGHLPDPRKVQSCLYLHTGACPAPCVARISQPAYYQIAKQAELFFEGRHDALMKRWDRHMRQAARRLDFETAAQLRDHIKTLQHMGERVSIRAIHEGDLEGRVSRSRALSELQVALALPTPPLVIEAFDISTIHGVESVGSLVVFDRGFPKKEAYRHFRIKTVSGLDDVAMMAEVVRRRYRRGLRAEQGASRFPDLILLDGGKGQLGAVEGVFTALRQEFPRQLPKQIPLTALAKRAEELFLPGKPDPVILPKDSPALHLVQHVRDEAHRFAVTFHRRRRTKRMYI